MRVIAFTLAVVSLPESFFNPIKCTFALQKIHYRENNEIIKISCAIGRRAERISRSRTIRPDQGGNNLQYLSAKRDGGPVRTIAHKANLCGSGKKICTCFVLLRHHRNV